MRSVGHNSGGDKNAAIAAAAITFVAVAVTMADNAAAQDDCMSALGWTPGGPARPVQLASSEPTMPIGATAEPAPSQADYPSLGFSTSAVTPMVASAMNMDRIHGVLITAVVPDSAASVFGLEQGDVVLSFNDNPIRSSDDIASAVEIGSDELRGSLTVWRDHEEVRFTLLSHRDTKFN